MAFVDVNTEVGEFGSDNAVGFDGATKSSSLMGTLAAADVIDSLPEQRVRVECVRRNRVNCERAAVLHAQARSTMSKYSSKNVLNLR